MNRRRFSRSALGGAMAIVGGCRRDVAPEDNSPTRRPVFVRRVPDYGAGLGEAMLQGLGRFPGLKIRGKSVLLKINLVETSPDRAINTDPRFVVAAAGAFRDLGASSVTVADGPGHHRDIDELLYRSGLGDLLDKAGIRPMDLNHQPVIQVRDAVGGLVAGNTSIVTATLTGSGGTLSGTTSVAAVNGIATFTNLVVTGAGTYTLTFSSSALSPVTSSPFTITPPPPASIALAMGTDAAVTGTIGVPLAVPIVADMSNAQGQVLASLSLNITWDPTKFDFVSVTNGSFGSSPSYFVNTNNAIYGALVVSMFDNTGFSTGSPRIYTVTLRPKMTASGAIVTSTVTAAGDDVGNSILTTKFVVRPVSITTP